MYCARDVGIEGSKADRGGGQGAGAENRGAEVEGGLVQRRGRREVVGLLSFGENVGYIVALIAPGILVHRRVEDAVRSA